MSSEHPAIACGYNTDGRPRVTIHQYLSFLRSKYQGEKYFVCVHIAKQPIAIMNRLMDSADPLYDDRVHYLWLDNGQHVQGGKLGIPGKYVEKYGREIFEQISIGEYSENQAAQIRKFQYSVARQLGAELFFHIGNGYYGEDYHERSVRFLQQNPEISILAIKHDWLAIQKEQQKTIFVECDGTTDKAILSRSLVRRLYQEKKQTKKGDLLRGEDGFAVITKCENKRGQIIIARSLKPDVVGFVQGDCVPDIPTSRVIDCDEVIKQIGAETLFNLGQHMVGFWQDRSCVSLTSEEGKVWDPLIQKTQASERLLIEKRAAATKKRVQAREMLVPQTFYSGNEPMIIDQEKGIRSPNIGHPPISRMTPRDRISRTVRKIKGVLWDFDGTLCDNEQIALQVILKNIYGFLGIQADPSRRVSEFVGRPFPEICRVLALECDKNMDQSQMLELKRRTDCEVLEMLGRSARPTKGVINVLHHVAAECLPQVVVTSGSPSRVDLCLKRSPNGLLRFFGQHTIFSAENPEKFGNNHPHKPNPAVYLWASETLGIPLNECLAIEDSPSGIKAAVAGGVGVIVGYTGGSHIDQSPAGQLAKAKELRGSAGDRKIFVINDMRQLTSLIEKGGKGILAEAPPHISIYHPRISSFAAAEGIGVLEDKKSIPLLVH